MLKKSLPHPLDVRRTFPPIEFSFFVRLEVCFLIAGKILFTTPLRCWKKSRTHPLDVEKSRTPPLKSLKNLSSY